MGSYSTVKRLFLLPMVVFICMASFIQCSPDEVNTPDGSTATCAADVTATVAAGATVTFKSSATFRDPEGNPANDLTIQVYGLNGTYTDPTTNTILNTPFVTKTNSDGIILIDVGCTLVGMATDCTVTYDAFGVTGCTAKISLTPTT